MHEESVHAEHFTPRSRRCRHTLGLLERRRRWKLRHRRPGRRDRAALIAGQRAACMDPVWNTTVDGILEKRLRLRDAPGHGEWRLWEYKSFNMHRGVLHWQPVGDPLSCGELAQAIRQRVKDTYRVSWWRGMAFGALVEVRDLPEDVTSIDASIDTRSNSQGTWQWLALVCREAKVAIGVHTWTEGYLTPAYRELLAHYESSGYRTGSFKKEKDRLIQFLTAAAKLKGFRFREFEP